LTEELTVLGQLCGLPTVNHFMYMLLVLTKEHVSISHHKNKIPLTTTTKKHTTMLS